MMRWLVDWSLKFRRIVVALAAGLLVFGLVQLDDIRKDVLPEFSPVTVEVQTEALGLSAAEMPARWLPNGSPRRRACRRSPSHRR
jgi:Cu/Ag efflux pump CusA